MGIGPSGPSGGPGGVQKVRVWLFKAVGKRAECVGGDNKCRAWLAKHERGSPSGFPLAWFGAPVMVPFGSYAVPAPGLNIEVLKKIAPDWKRPCRSKRPCRVNKKNANWVFYENGGEVLRKGDTTIHFLKFSNFLIFFQFKIEKIGNSKNPPGRDVNFFNFSMFFNLKLKN